jgi:hypothetical protein
MNRGQPDDNTILTIPLICTFITCGDAGNADVAQQNSKEAEEHKRIQRVFLPQKRNVSMKIRVAQESMRNLHFGTYIIHYSPVASAELYLCFCFSANMYDCDFTTCSDYPPLESHGIIGSI